MVACGAAIQAAILNFDSHISITNMLLMDVNPLSLGVNLHGGITQGVIESNSKIPAKKETVLITTEDFQTGMSFQVIEGNTHSCPSK